MKILKFTAAYDGQEWLSPCYVGIDSDGKLQSFGQEPPVGAISEAIDGYLLPGQSNAHSHSFQYAMAGMTESLDFANLQDDFWSWREKMYHVANSIDPSQLLELTTQFYMALLEEGYTGVCEFHYLHHDRDGKAYADSIDMSQSLMQAAERSGIHLTLVPVYYHQSSPGVPIKPQQRRFYFANVDEYLQLLERINTYSSRYHPSTIVGYGVHSARAAPPADLKFLLGTQWSLGPSHLHVSEQAEDARIFEQVYHCRAIDWLYDNVPLDRHHNLVHATHINDMELKKIAAADATVILCPSTEANLGDGVFPLPEFQTLGGSWCIGTDSHVGLSPFAEMRSPELLHRLLLERRNLFCSGMQLDSGKIIFDRVTKSGLRALGRSQNPFTIGQLFEGIVLDAEHDRLLGRPLHYALSIAVFAGDKSLLKSVYAKGEKKVERGVHKDRAIHRQDFAKAMKKIFES